jgi:hypothetical protein
MMRDFWVYVFVVVVLVLMMLPACEHDSLIMDPGPIDTMPVDTIRTCHPDTIYFERDVLPIVLSSCGMALCHDAVTKQEGLQYTSYQTIMETGKVVPFQPLQSQFYTQMTETNLSLVMPPSPRGPISDTNIAVIRKWIEQGALNLTCTGDTTCTVPATVSFAQDVFPVVDKYCKGCHSGANPWAGLRLRNYAEVKTIASNGLLLSVINHVPGFPQMPMTIGKLDSCTIVKITQWVDNGAPNN